MIRTLLRRLIAFPLIVITFGLEWFGYWLYGGKEYANKESDLTQQLYNAWHGKKENGHD